jgi:branched-chain amino acid transport system ATP-binding protein
LVVGHPWANGAGKSTILKAISSVLRLDEGSISFENQRVDQIPAHRLVDMGIAHVSEGRRLFARLSVEQNLTLGAYTRKSLEHRVKAGSDFFLKSWVDEISRIM